MVSVVDQRNNPYIVGPPIRRSDLLFGRDSVFKFIEDNLKQYAVKIILLHGQRRIGKSSVLLNIPNFIGEDEFIFVFFDLQNKSSLNLGDVLHQLSREIVKRLGLPSDVITLPSVRELEQDTDIFSNEFLPQINQRLNHKKLVVLLDEFDVLDDPSANSSFKKLFPYLQSIIYQQQQLVLIPVIGRQPGDLENLLSLFKDAPNKKIGLLDMLSAEQLIIKSAENVLEYEPEAIEEICKLAAGHPYFTQGICWVLFTQARQAKKWRVTGSDIEKIVDRAIEITEGGLAWFRDGLPMPERVVFSAVAEAQARAETEPDGVVREPLKLLRNYGVIITEPLIKAEKKLCDSGFVDVEPLAKLPVYKIKIELVRRWLVKRYLLRSEIWELEELDLDALEIYGEADEHHQRGNTLKAYQLYEEVLARNPNHFSALLGLAEVHVRLKDINKDYSKSKDIINNLIKDISKAVGLYARAYKVDPVRMEEEFVELLLIYGEHLNSLREFEIAKKQFERVLKIQPDNLQVQKDLKDIEEKLEEIKAKQRQRKVLFQVLIICLLVVGSLKLAFPQVRNIFNNRAIEREYKERFAEAVSDAEKAILLSNNSQSIEELQNVSNTLNKVVNDLSEIPSYSNLSGKAEKKVEEYNDEIRELTQQIDGLHLEQAAKLAAKASQETEQANSIEELEQVKVLWKQSVKELEAISSNSLPAQQANRQKKQYNTELKKITQQIDKQRLAKAEAFAAIAAQQTRQATITEELEDVKLLWEQALKELDKISPDSSLAQDVNREKVKYEEELAEIARKIEELRDKTIKE
ncbi:MAG: AAA family ATPase [Symploca sp. SIO1B1]|nr:AAA family ATPase [Symploca sp. SIO1B1]